MDNGTPKFPLWYLPRKRRINLESVPQVTLEPAGTGEPAEPNDNCGSIKPTGASPLDLIIVLY